MSKIKPVNKTRVEVNGEILHITGESRGKTMTMKEAIKAGLVKVENKELMQKMFSKEELEEMGYDYNTEEKE